MRIVPAVALGLMLATSRSPMVSAGEPLPYSHGGPTSGYQDPYSTGYGVSGAGIASDAPYSTGCAASCPHCGHQGSKLGHLFWRGLPNPHHSTCDMPQHHLYFAEPKFYYYFRPYNWFHIPVQQDDVRAFGGDPRHPYDNRIFQSVYGQLHFEEPAPEAIVPPEATIPPSSGAKPGRESRAASGSKTAVDAVVPAKTAQRADSPSTLRVRRVTHPID